MKIRIKKQAETDANAETTQYKLIKVGTTNVDKTYVIAPPCKTVIGLSYTIFNELARSFIVGQKQVVRTFYLEAMNGKYKGIITKYEGTRTLESEEKPYKYKFYVKNWGGATKK